MEPRKDVYFPILIRGKNETRKLERKSKQQISRINDLFYRLNDIISRYNDYWPEKKMKQEN